MTKGAEELSLVVNLARETGKKSLTDSENVPQLTPEELQGFGGTGLRTDALRYADTLLRQHAVINFLSNKLITLFKLWLKRCKKV